MCITPNEILVDGREVTVACHKCWQCLSNRVNDYVGRCIAETHYSSDALAITLTYGGGDTPEAAILTYSDVQKFMKRLRKAGYKVRYIVAGEYGGEKGRAHWHLVLFFDGNSPEIVDRSRMKKSVLELNPAGSILEPTKRICLNERMMWQHWPHGYSFVEKPSYESYRYILKYLMKDQSNGKTAVRNFGLSKKPPLGDKYFRELAVKHVDQGLAPRSYEYGFDDEYDKKGKRRTFFMQGKTRENFLNYFNELWWKKFARRPPAHEILIEADRKEAEYENDFRWDHEYEKKRKSRNNAIQKLGGELESSLGAKSVRKKDRRVDLDVDINGVFRGVFVQLVYQENEPMYVIYENEEGRQEWRVEDQQIIDRIMAETIVTSTETMEDRLYRQL